MTAQSAHILVVDDEPSVLLTYQLILQQEGYKVTGAATSREALEALRQNNVDLLLCDLSLEEERSGFDVIESARRRNPDLPTVILTGYANKEVMDRAERAQIGILFKPIDIDEFLRTIASALGEDNDKAKASGE
jgi:two-component system, NtrC family, response regulator GlrR